MLCLFGVHYSATAFNLFWLYLSCTVDTSILFRMDVRGVPVQSSVLSAWL